MTPLSDAELVGELLTLADAFSSGQPKIGISPKLRQAASRIEALLWERDEARCEHCGARISSYPNGCPGCGAPQCCQSCCERQNAITRAEAVEAQLAAERAARERMETALREIEELNRGEVEGCPKGADFDIWDAGYADGMAACAKLARAALKERG